MRPPGRIDKSTCLSAVVAVSALGWLATHERANEREPALGDVAQVEEDYARWKLEFESGPRVLEIGLGWSKALTRDRGPESGVARFDLERARVSIEIASAHEDLDAWLVENRDAPGASVAPDPTDAIVHVGTLRTRDGSARIDADLAHASARDVRPDLVVITRAGGDPLRDARLVGQPGLYERLWSAERSARAHAARSGLVLAAVTSAGPHVAMPDAPLRALVALGEDLFFNATFDGNGRTCGTCHPAENDFTLDAAFVATLPPTDPLFVAEYDPNLMQDPVTGARFETPALMRSAGLITINPDGFDDLAQKYVLRAVSHTFAQSLSIERPSVSSAIPAQRTGWAGDGAPGSGSLREFATGAVIQHMTKRMSRTPGVDFRLPTDHELDALEAFLLSIGRRVEMDTASLRFLEPSMSAGQATFGVCTICHHSAGANGQITEVAGVVLDVGNPSHRANGNFDTGIERFLHAHPGSSGIARPIDGGFGVLPIDPPPGGSPDVPGPNQDGSFGDKTFNTPSVVEFADTAPAFHNHALADGQLGADQVEAAVRFYTTTEFGDTPGGQFTFAGPMPLSNAEVANIAAFLRGINALENARESRANLTRAALVSPDTDRAPAVDAIVDRRLAIARADVADGRDVLAAKGLAPAAVAAFELALARIDAARDATRTWTARRQAMRDATAHVDAARASIVIVP